MAQRPRCMLWILLSGKIGGGGSTYVRNTHPDLIVVTCGCEPENANTTPEIATTVTGGAVSGVAFVFSGGRKRKCNDGRPESEFFLLGS